MILDLSQVLTNDGASLRIDAGITPEDMSVNGQEIHFTCPVSVEGSVKNVSGILYLDIRCKAVFETQCARCLDTVAKELEFDIAERMAKSSTDEDVLIIESHEFDLEDAVIKGFGLELPINYMCSESCKGLCQVCGCNLNHTQCDCEDDYVDPRLAALKDFLK